MKSQTYMEKLYQLATGKKNPLDVFGPQVGEQVTPQLGPEMPPPGFPAPLKYPPSEETVDVARNPLPVKVINKNPPQTASLSTNQDLINALPFLNNLLPSNILASFESSKKEDKMPSVVLAPKIEAGNKKVENLSKKPILSTEPKAAPSLIEATIKTANNLNSSDEKLPIPSDKRATALPYGPAEDIKAATSEATGAMKPGIADAEQGKSLEQAQRDQSRDILQDFILTKTFPDQRQTSRAGELLQELLFETQQRVKEFDPNSVERKQLNRLTEAILAFGGPLLGALTGGTAGLMAGAVSGQAGLQTLAQARKDLEADYQTRMKLTALNINEQLKSMNRDQIERLKGLMGLEKLDADEFKTRLQYETQILRTQMELAKAAFGFDSREHIEAKKLYYNFIKAFSDLLVKGATAAATTATKADQAEKDRESRETIARENNAIKIQLAKIKENYRRLYGDKKTTDAERRAAGYLTTALMAADSIKELYGPNFDEYPALKNPAFRTMAGFISGDKRNILVADLGNYLIDKVYRYFGKTEEAERMRQAIAAELSILESVGRIRSGAVIRIDEYWKIRGEMFPTYGDSPKKVRRTVGQFNAAIAALRIMAGRAASNVPAPETLLPPLPQKSTKDALPQKSTKDESARIKQLEQLLKKVEKIQNEKKQQKK